MRSSGSQTRASAKAVGARQAGRRSQRSSRVAAAVRRSRVASPTAGAGPGSGRSKQSPVTARDARARPVTARARRAASSRVRSRRRSSTGSKSQKSKSRATESQSQKQSRCQQKKHSKKDKTGQGRAVGARQAQAQKQWEPGKQAEGARAAALAQQQ